ncbi:MAG: hypothetical protein CM15mP21_6090 [Hyphomicrobiales bacterium]|nr:MAG: hypothetical protein CM15mP21_6090 [Hyphomicrobiales bacterium]
MSNAFASENGKSGNDLRTGTFHIENNVVRGGFVGRLVANDFSAAMVRAELLDLDVKPANGWIILNWPKNWSRIFAPKFENDKYEVQIIGFAKLIGDIADGAGTWFSSSACVDFDHHVGIRLCALGRIDLSAAILFADIACLAFGILKLLGYGLDPLAILVPFLVFAIGVSHGVQQINLSRPKFPKDVLVMRRRASFRGLLIPGPWPGNRPCWVRNINSYPIK